MTTTAPSPASPVLCLPIHGAIQAWRWHHLNYDYAITVATAQGPFSHHLRGGKYSVGGYRQVYRITYTVDGKT